MSRQEEYCACEVCDPGIKSLKADLSNASRRVLELQEENGRLMLTEKLAYLIGGAAIGFLGAFIMFSCWALDIGEGIIQ